jgi:hypothetical protein
MQATFGGQGFWKACSECKVAIEIGWESFLFCFFNQGEKEGRGGAAV